MNEMYGVVNGAFFNNIERSVELSKRISQRNIPSKPLQAQFSVRPISTKYDIMSVVDGREKSSVSLKRHPVYNTSNTFNPGNAQGPWLGFATNVNDESKLRNQFFALQRCDNAAYIPSSKSDMYHVNVGGRMEVQSHPGLFENPDLGYFNPNPDNANVGHNIFNNSTRDQIKNV